MAKRGEHSGSGPKPRGVQYARRLERQEVYNIQARKPRGKCCALLQNSLILAGRIWGKVLGKWSKKRGNWEMERKRGYRRNGLVGSAGLISVPAA